MLPLIPRLSFLNLPIGFQRPIRTRGRNEKDSKSARTRYENEKDSNSSRNCKYYSDMSSEEQSEALKAAIAYCNESWRGTKPEIEGTSRRKDGSGSGNVGTVAMSKLEDESEREAVSVDDKGIQANVDFDPEGCKENEKTSDPEPSLPSKKGSTMSSARQKRMLLVKDFHSFRTKFQEPKPNTEVESAEDAAALVYVGVTQGNVDESAKESEVLVLPSGGESSKKSTNDAAKMTQNTVASGPNATDANALPSNGEETEPASFISTLPAEGPVHDDFKVSEDNVVFVLKEDEENVVPLGAEKTSESATSILSDLVNEEICPAFEDNFLEFIKVSNSIRIRDKPNLGFMDGSNTSGDDLVFLGNNSAVDSPCAAEIGSKDSSIAILVEDGSGFIQKQDDDMSLPVVVTLVGKENKVDIQIQNDKGSLNSPRAACPSSSEKMRDGLKRDDEHEALLATKSTFSADELHQTSPLLSSSGCVLCELVGGQVNHDGKILTTGAQINRFKKMLEEELLATEKLRATLKKLLDDLEAVQNNNDYSLSA